MVIRRSRNDEDDQNFLRQLAHEVFSGYGPYDSWIPEWSGYPGVLTYVGTVDQRNVAFSMLTFYREDPLAVVGDLLAIAVDSAAQRGGLGSSLLSHAKGVAQQLGAQVLMLSVAEPNTAAQRLFSRHGFQFLTGDFGSYEGGQRTLRMRLELRGRISSQAHPGPLE